MAVLTQKSPVQLIAQKLFEPAKITDAVQKRNGSLAAAVAFAVAPLLIIAWLITHRPILILLGGLVALSYVATRIGYLKIGSALLVIGFSIWYLLYLGEVPDLNLASARSILYWSIIPVLIASALFSIRGVFYSALINIGFILVTPLLYPNLTFRDAASIMSFPMTVIVLILVVIRHRDGVERIRQQTLRDALNAVRESEAKLENRVVERTHALEQRTLELQAAKVEADRANGIKTQFLAMVSHELRTPLNGIINFSAFVAEGLFGPVNEKQQSALRDVGKAGNHLLALINDVLDISKIESGSLRLFVESDIDLNAELDDLLRSAQPLLGDKPVQLRQEIAPNLPRITGDKRRIRQIMLNIIANACKFTEAGSITVGAKRENGHIHLWVQDTGPGIAPEDHRAVFETFKQTEAGLRSGGGTGLGMPISQKLAEAHGGKLWLESVRGEGATFHVHLPIEIAATDTEGIRTSA